MKTESQNQQMETSEKKLKTTMLDASNALTELNASLGVYYIFYCIKI